MNIGFSRIAKWLFSAACLAISLGVHSAPGTPPVSAQATVQRTIIGNAANIPLAQSQDTETIRTIGVLRKQAATAGSVRVIVGMRVAFAAEGVLDQSTAQLQRKDIAAMQASVLDRLPAFQLGTKSAKRLEFIPFMALEANSLELDKLLSFIEVTSMEEDKAVPAQLAESNPLIGATTAWGSGYTGAGQVVAILDTGVDKNHPFLSGKVVSEGCFSSNNSTDGATSLCPGYATSSTAVNSALPYGTGVCPSGKCDHGTHVAGIAAGSGASFSGVAKDASIIAVQVFSRFINTTYCVTSSSCALTYKSDQLLGLQHVYSLRSTYNIAAVNMSLGGGSNSSQSTCDSANASAKAAIDNLRSVNIATVISSGNDGYVSSMGAPGCISTAVSVGATWDSSYPAGRGCPVSGVDYGGVDKVTCYSNSVSFLNLLAPGSAIYSSTPYSSGATYHGTSMAAPHVAGAWALLKQKKPNITVTEALTALSSTGVSVTDTRNGVTKPRININAALASVVATALPSAPTIGTAVSGNSSISVNFTPGSIGSGTLVQYWAGCSADNVNILYGTGNSPPVVVPSLTNGLTYLCYALAESTLGYGAWSTGSNAVVVGLAGAPTSVSTAAAPGGIRVSFVAPVNTGAGITGYTATCSASGQTTKTATGSTSPITVGGLTFGVTYSCTVTANTAYGSSSASSVATASPGKTVDLTPILMLLLD